MMAGAPRKPAPGRRDAPSHRAVGEHHVGLKSKGRAGQSILDPYLALSNSIMLASTRCIPTPRRC